MHVVIDIVHHCSIVWSCQHIPCVDLHGCNVSWCRVFSWGLRCDRSLSCTQFCHGVGWTHLSLKLPHLFYLVGLQPYLCNKYSLWGPWCNKCVIELCYKSSRTVCVSILIQAWHLSTETLIHWDRVATSPRYLFIQSRCLHEPPGHVLLHWWRCWAFGRNVQRRLSILIPACWSVRKGQRPSRITYPNR